LEFKRVSGPGRRIRVQDSQVRIDTSDDASFSRQLASRQTSGLGTLARLSEAEIGPGPSSYVRFLSSIRILEPNVEEARRPARMTSAVLASDAHNLASALIRLQTNAPDSFALLVDDMSRCLPGLS